MKEGKRNHWRLARKIMQGIALMIFIFTVWMAKNADLAPDQFTAIIRISPLAMLSNLLSSKVFLGGSLLALIMLLSSLLVGRAWCGWLCPLGTVLDLFRFSRKKRKWEPPQNFRKIKYGILIVTLVAAIFGNLTLLIFDPLTIFIRSLSISVIPFLDRSIFALEKQLFQVPFLSSSVIKFDAWLRPDVFPVEAPVFQYSLLFGLFFIGIILLNLIAHRFWCRYLCPLGALLGLGAKFSLIQRQVNAHCVSCGLCEGNCPTGTIEAKNQYQSDPSECTMCMDCLSSCKYSAITFPSKWQPASFNSYDPDRRLVVGGIAVGLAGIFLTGLNWLKNIPRNFLLRPPGVQDHEVFLSKCIRCGVCIQVCPTQALQADMNLADLEGVSTPILIPRMGYCDYACNACGEHCPVDAIPTLSMEQKRATKIGRAVIDHSRCIAWAEHSNCIVCEEMCPLPDKAIYLHREAYVQADGSTIELLLPVVDPHQCIGCGICENKCPVEGEAAIRVQSIYEL